MRPVNQHVLVKPFESDEVSTGGIYVPENAREVSNKVRVIAVGNGTAQKPMRFKAGDIAFRVKDSGDEILIEGEKHFLLPQSYLIAKLDECQHSILV